MGRGIAELMASAGLEVQLWDIKPTALGRASAAIERSLRKQYELGRMNRMRLDETLERIRLVSDIRVVNTRTDLVLEAVVEDLEVKKSVFTQVEKHLREAWFITHTSSISIGEISRGLQRPERLLGMHFFNPAPVMPLVEIVYSIHSDKDWLRMAINFAEAHLGKQTVVVKDTPGFASSRLSTAMALEAMRMLEQKIATVEDIDKTMEYGYRHPMGPLRLSDWIGLDVRLSVAQVLYSQFKSDIYKPPRILEQMVAEGKLGRKTGEGFYRWPKEGF